MRKGRKHSPREAAPDAADQFVSNGQCDRLTTEFLSEWEQWWATPENRAEYLEVARIHVDLRALPRPGAVSQADLLADTFIACEPDLPIHSAPVPAARALRRNSSRLAAAWIGALVIALSTLMFFRFDGADSASLRHAFLTRPGQQLQDLLPDGSTMTLGGDTSVSVQFTATARYIYLHRGEALFSVHPEPGRPFLVCAADGCTRALGTVFDVRRYSNHVRVWVQSGVVEVTSREPFAPGKDAVLPRTDWAPMRLSHDQEINYDSKGAVAPPTQVDAHSSAAWTEGSLIYHGRPLAEVIEDVQRYARRPILLDPAVGDLLYSGSVLQLRVDEWLAGLAAIFPIETVDCLHHATSSLPACSVDPNRVLIRSRDSL